MSTAFQRFRTILVCSIGAAVWRYILGQLAMFVVRHEIGGRESEFMVFLDLPTVVLMLLSGLDVVGPGDPDFHYYATVTWAFLGVLLGLAVIAFQSWKAKYRRDVLR